MKRIFGVFLILNFIILLMVGCKGSTNTEAYEKAAKECLTFIYTYEEADKIIDENDQFERVVEKAKTLEKYYTENGDQGLMPRVAGYAIVAGSNHRSTVTAKNIDLKYYNKIEDTGAHVYNYTVNIVSTPIMEGSVREIEVTGQIQVVKIGKEYKINRVGIDDYDKWSAFSR